MYIKSYKELIVWQKSVDLVEKIYFLTNQFPKEEIYGLSSQMRRAAVSIPSNIAEGQRRKDLPEFLHFLRIADASSAELETQVIISKKLYPKLDYAKVDGLLEEVQKMLTVIMSKLELKANSSKLKAVGGFTLVELLVAMTLFVIVIGISAGSFIQILRAQRMLVTLISANNNAALTLEAITREIRTGRNFSKNGDDLLFTNAQGSEVIYHWNSSDGFLEKKTGAGEFKKLTADDVRVTRAMFNIFPDDQFPPRITIVLAVGAAGLPFNSPVINLEMTASSRVFQ